MLKPTRAKVPVVPYIAFHLPDNDDGYVWTRQLDGPMHTLLIEKGTLLGLGQFETREQFERDLKKVAKDLIGHFSVLLDSALIAEVPVDTYNEIIETHDLTGVIVLN